MNNKDTDHQMPPVALLRICRCNALVVSTNACPHCNAGWAEVKAPVTQYTRVDPPAAPTGDAAKGFYAAEDVYAATKAFWPPGEADKALALKAVREIDAAFESSERLRLGKWVLPDERETTIASFIAAALAQARKETWELAAGHVIDEAGKVGQLMNAAADSARKEERASVKSTFEDYFKHFPCTCVRAPRTGGHFAVCPITIRDEVLGRLEGLASASKQER